jgi:uncharacterized protein (UPF0254 family)
MSSESLKSSRVITLNERVLALFVGWFAPRHTGIASPVCKNFFPSHPQNVYTRRSELRMVRPLEEPMALNDDVLSYTNEQGRRARKLFAAVVLAALDDAIKDEKTYGVGKGAEGIARWANSRDGIEVLTNAGIEVNSRTVDGLVAFVKRGVRVSNALSLKDDSEKVAA